MTDFDFNDRLIREMVDRNHAPTEVWDMGGRLVSCHCAECGNPWPCPTRQALREWVNQ